MFGAGVTCNVPPYASGSDGGGGIIFFRDTNFRFLLLGFSRRIVGIPELFCSFYTAALHLVWDPRIKKHLFPPDSVPPEYALYLY